jgi:hypothetical protein
MEASPGSGPVRHTCADDRLDPDGGTEGSRRAERRAAEMSTPAIPLETGEEVLASGHYEYEPGVQYLTTSFGRKIRVEKASATVVMGPPFVKDAYGGGEPARPVPNVKVGVKVHVLASDAGPRREPRHRCVEATVRDVGEHGLIGVVSPQLGGARSVRFSSRGFVAAQYSVKASDQRPAYTWHDVRGCRGTEFQKVAPDHVRPGDDL